MQACFGVLAVMGVKSSSPISLIKVSVVLITMFLELGSLAIFNVFNSTFAHLEI